MNPVVKSVLTACALCCALAAGIVARTARADDGADGPAVTPYRPSVSTPAALSAPGWVEGEFGLSRTQGGDSAHRDSLPYTVKLAFTPDWGVRIGGEALARSEEFDGTRTTGFGDTSVVLKRRFAIDDQQAFGLEAGANFPTAKRGLGSGKTDASLNGIYSADFGDFHTDLNLIATHLGQVDDGQSRWQTTWAASLSHPLGADWGLVGEFSGTRQTGSTSTAQFLAAASYNLSRRAVLDVGAARGLNHASPDWSVFAGITVLLGRAF